MSLTALALNPNLTPDQFKRLAEEHRQGVKELFETAKNEGLKLPPDQRAQYAQAVLPMLIMYALF